MPSFVIGTKIGQAPQPDRQLEGAHPPVLAPQVGDHLVSVQLGQMSPGQVADFRAAQAERQQQPQDRRIAQTLDRLAAWCLEQFARLLGGQAVPL